MSFGPTSPLPGGASARPEGRGSSRAVALCGRAALGLALTLLVATFFLISPRAGQTYPGAKPWSDLSVLRPITELMSLYGSVQTARGVEIKDFAFQLAVTAGLVLLAFRLVLTPGSPVDVRRMSSGAWAQVLLAAWVLLSLTSSLWSGDPALARGQAVLYGFNLAWAVVVAATLRRRDLPRLLRGLAWVSAAAATVCVWYYYERNPYHRPGFPVGNPTTLAAAILPGVLISVAVVAAGVAEAVRARRLTGDRRLLLGVALVPLLWCLVLTSGRGALLALLAGLATMVFCLIGRRVRWLMAGVFLLGIAGTGAWFYYSSHLEVTMGRGASARFRLYAWRYAAELWRTSPIRGHGAGCYPRLAGEHAAADRALDPAAFMAQIVGHAHNEYFEIFSEIGLVGGVTFVGGLVATFFAAAELLRSRGRGVPRWLVVALVGSIAALLMDAGFGVALRLPGVGPILFTLLGALWSVAGVERGHEDAGAAGPAERRRVAGFTAVLSVLACCGAAGGAGWLTLRNWTGVRLEQEAASAVEAKPPRYLFALNSIQRAEDRLLDPVQRVDARRHILDWRMGLARQAFVACAGVTATAPTEDARQRALRLAREAYTTALTLRHMVPALEYTDANAARAAEWLAALSRTPRDAAAWARVAEQAWRYQRRRTPYHVNTLLALTRYRAPLAVQFALLRDALRFLDTVPDPVDLDAAPDEDAAEALETLHLWTAVLAHMSQEPAAAQVLGSFMAEVGPITAQTDVDALVASMAPETHRLVAAWDGLRGAYEEAAAEASRAAQLYTPMRARFPELCSRALAEQADYVLRGAPARAAEAVELLRQAIRALPVIQTQQYERMTHPYRRRLVTCLLAAGEEPEARQIALRLVDEGQDADARQVLAASYVELATMFIRRPADQRPPVRDWLQAAVRQLPADLLAWSWLAWLDAERSDADALRTTLRAAAEAGVPEEGLALIRRSLGQEFPNLQVPSDGR